MNFRMGRHKRMNQLTKSRHLVIAIETAVVANVSSTSDMSHAWYLRNCRRLCDVPIRFECPLAHAGVQAIPNHDMILVSFAKVINCYLPQLRIITSYTTISNAGSSYRYCTITARRRYHMYIRNA